MRQGSIRRAVLGLAAVLLVAGVRQAGAQAGADVQDVSVAPIECWMRTTARAVRVGEPFTLVLTCAVLDTASTTVVPDQTRLDPAVLQIPPFEVVGGAQAADLRTTSQRFFQYEYTVRFIGETIGDDILLPGPTITYRVQSRVQRDSAVEGRERQYVLPPQTIRIVSLVPDTAGDIQDALPDTFRAIDARRTRAAALGIVRWVLLGLAAVTVVWAAAGLVRRPKAAAAVPYQVPARAALVAATRELARVADARRAGWTPELAAQAMAALRVSASYVSGRAVAQRRAEAGLPPSPGQLAVTASWPRRRMLISGSATAETLAPLTREAESAGRPVDPAASDLETALARFGSAVYGRDAALDESALDEALEAGLRGSRAVAGRYTWPARTWRAVQQSLAGMRERAVWAR